MAGSLSSFDGSGNGALRSLEIFDLEACATLSVIVPSMARRVLEISALATFGAHDRLMLKM